MGGAHTRRDGRQTPALAALACLCLTLAACSGDGGGSAASSSTSAPASCVDLLRPAREVDPSLVHVNVFNGGGAQGLAGKVADQLSDRGFQVIQTSNDPRGTRPRAPVVIRYGSPGVSIARTLAAQVDGASLVNDGRWDPSVDLVIGASFDRLVELPPAEVGTFEVNVYNTTSTPGLAQEAGAELAKRGHRVGATGNDPLRSWWPDDTAVVRHGPEGEPAARTTAAQVPGARLVEDKREGTSVDLVLGARYTRLQRAARATPEPMPSAHVSVDPRCAGATLPTTATGASSGPSTARPSTPASAPSPTGPDASGPSSTTP